MSRFRTLTFIAAASLALLTGCKSDCRQLSEKLCECSRTPIEKTSCLARAGVDDGLYEASKEENARCAALMKGCDCHLIDTPEGKKACGLAR